MSTTQRTTRDPDETPTWLWGPFAVTAVAAGLGYGLAAGTGPVALGVAAGVLLVPALVLGVALFLGRPLYGVDRPEEVGYIAGTLAALAGWTTAVGTWSWPLAAGTAAAVAAGVVWWLAWGPGQRAAMLADFLGAAAGLLALAGLNPVADPAPWRWLLAPIAGTALAATPYWMHRRNRAAAAPLAEVDIGPLVTAIGKHLHAAVELQPDSLNVGPHGRHSIRLRLSNGKTAADVVAVLVRVESELGLREGALSAAGQRARRNEVTVTVVPVEPKSAELVRPPLPTAITEPVAIGRYDTGDLMLISLYDGDGARGALVGGVKGSGKSRTLWTWMQAWTHSDDNLIMFGDFSGGATSEPWMPCLYRRYTDPDKFLQFLIALEAGAKWRASQLPLRGWESWQPSHDDPAIIVPIDEAQSLLKGNWAAQQQVERIIQIDRKSGISLVIMQPNPVQMEGISPTIREQARIRLCFLSLGTAVRWVLGGTRAEPMSYAVREFTAPGQVLGDGPGMQPVPGRGFDTNLAESKASAIKHAGRRPVLDAGTAAAMAKATATRKNPAGEDFSRPQHELEAAQDGDRPAEERWTDADAQAAADAHADHAGLAGLADLGATEPDLRAALAEMASHDTLLGRDLPPLPTGIKPPKERLSTEQALALVARLVAQPGGTTPAVVELATGRSRSWVFGVLSSWVRDGAAKQPEQGLYVAAAAPAGT